VLALFEACKFAPRQRIEGIPQTLYWRIFIAVTWDTALRCGDALSIRLADIQANGKFMLTQQKTGWAHVCQLRQSTLDLIRESIPPQRKLLLPWPNCGKFFRERFSKLVTMAGIPQGSSKWLRRASATEIERCHPGAAMSHLGHRTPGLAYRSYVDPRIIESTRPLVTSLLDLNELPPPPTPRETPQPQLATHYGVPLINPDAVLRKLQTGERLGGVELHAAIRLVEFSIKDCAKAIRCNAKHLGQILRGNLPTSPQLERKLRKWLLKHLAHVESKGGAA
jgi:hypothetical protein